jgi:hypothetical protein
LKKYQRGKAKKIICVFPIAWSSKLGSVGRDFFFFFFETYKYAPSSKITQTCLFLSYYSLLISWHAVQCFCYYLCVFSILYFYTWIIMMLKHRSNVQGNEENSNRKLVFNKSVSIKRLSESVNIATVKRLLLKSETNKETETNFRILPIYFFFYIKNVRIGGKILGLVGRSETHIFIFLA